jgi:hypothetical protein
MPRLDAPRGPARGRARANLRDLSTVCLSTIAAMQTRYRKNVFPLRRRDHAIYKCRYVCARPRAGSRRGGRALAALHAFAPPARYTLLTIIVGIVARRAA